MFRNRTAEKALALVAQLVEQQGQLIDLLKIHTAKLTNTAVVTEPVAEEGIGLPDEVVNAITGRTGSLYSKAAQEMVKLAIDALERGRSPEDVAQWMWEGEAADQEAVS